jgi:organic hydroperoxide reductase OsmC/OhrA
VARFAPLYEVPLEDASVEVRCSFDVADKLGLDGPGAAFEEVTFAVAIQSAAPPARVRQLIAHAERGCHAEQTLRQPIPVKTSVTLNGQSLPV